MITWSLGLHLLDWYFSYFHKYKHTAGFHNSLLAHSAPWMPTDLLLWMSKRIKGNGNAWLWKEMFFLFSSARIITYACDQIRGPFFKSFSTNFEFSETGAFHLEQGSSAFRCEYIKLGLYATICIQTALLFKRVLEISFPRVIFVVHRQQILLFKLGKMSMVFLFWKQNWFGNFIRQSLGKYYARLPRQIGSITAFSTIW